MKYQPGMQVIFYDADDQIIQVLVDKRDVVAFLNGYYGRPIGYHHYEIVC